MADVLGVREERVMKRTEKRTKRGPWRPPGQPLVSQAAARVWETQRMWELQRFFSVPAPHLYDISKNLESLAARLGLPVPELARLIEEGKIPRRRWVNKKGHRYGPVLVLIHDALKGIEGTGRGNAEDVP